ncbi:adenylate/guanylate cyclase domain-containing protein [Ferruginibacter sp.]
MTETEKKLDKIKTEIEKLHRETLAKNNQTIVMFCDLVNSTAYKSKRELLTSLIKVFRHNSELDKHIRKNHGTIVKSLGDGVLATFKIDDPEDIIFPIQAAIQINQAFKNFNSLLNDDEKIFTKIGISLGNVVDFSIINSTDNNISDPHGPIVDLASRLCSLAEGGQILCDMNVIDLLSRATAHFDISPPYSRKVKGFEENVTISLINWDKSIPQTLKYPDPIFYNSGFLSTNFVLDKLKSTSNKLVLTGLSNRFFVDNIEILNELPKRIAKNKAFKLELIFLNPYSKFLDYSKLITRRKVTELNIFDNIKKACAFYAGFDSNLILTCSDFPMIVPSLISDEKVYFTLPLKSTFEEGLIEGVVNGPYFSTDMGSNLGLKIFKNISSDRIQNIPIKQVNEKEIILEEFLK